MAFTYGQSITDHLKKLEEEQRQRREQAARPSDGVYLFVLFPSYGGSNVYEVGKDCVRAKSYMQGGRFVGIARKVFSYGFETKTDEACIVFHFVDRPSAVNFFTSEPNFKQPDFPKCVGHCQAWLVDRYYTPNDEQALNTFMISEVRLHDGQDIARYKREFATPFADLLQREDARPYVVQTTDCLGLRRFCKDPKNFVTIHLFKNPFDVDKVMCSDEYIRLMHTHDSLAFEMCTVFTIEKKACP